MQFHGVKEGNQYIPFTLRQCLISEREKKTIIVVNMTRALNSVCSALEYLHHKGILHNDLKADNIVLEKQGTVDCCLSLSTLEKPVC